MKFYSGPHDKRMANDIDEMMEMASRYTEDVDMVNSPPHYADKRIECIDYIDDTVPDSYSYNFGNAIKYLSRHMNKGKPVQDLEKCKWYIDRMIKDYE